MSVPGTPIKLGATAVELPGMDVSWAGECPWTGRLCFGTEDGKLVFIGQDLRPIDPVLSAIPSEEAVNGVAFADDRLVVTSATDIAIWDRAGPGPNDLQLLASYPSGAHAVSPLTGGGFVAPIGPDGLLLIEPSQSGAPSLKTLAPRGYEVYGYRARQLGTRNGERVIGSAQRRKGFMIISAAPGEYPRSARGLVGKKPLDFVDICPLESPEHPAAFVALAADSSIHFAKDIFLDRGIRSFNFLPGLSGTAYSLFRMSEDLYILTSERLYKLPGFAEKIFDDAYDFGFEFTHAIGLEAVDVFPAFGEAIIAVLPDTTLIFDRKELFPDSLTSNGIGGVAERPNRPQVISYQGLITEELGAFRSFDFLSLAV